MAGRNATRHVHVWRHRHSGVALRSRPRPTQRCGMMQSETIHRTSTARATSASHGSASLRAYRQINQPAALCGQCRKTASKRGLLFAATESSVHVSFDDGDHWQSLRLNLPTTSFYDLTDPRRRSDCRKLRAGCMDSGRYIAARTVDRDTRESPGDLFRPRAGIRVQSNINQDTPFPPEVPHGKNPPQGVVIDYYSEATCAECAAADFRCRQATWSVPTRALRLRLSISLCRPHLRFGHGHRDHCRRLRVSTA